MDAEYNDFLTKGQAFLESLFGGRLIWDGVSYDCVCSGARMGDQLEDGGFVETGVRNVRVLKSAMIEAPCIGELLLLDDVEVRLVEVGDRKWDVAWHLQFQPVRGQ